MSLHLTGWLEGIHKEHERCSLERIVFITCALVMFAFLATAQRDAKIESTCDKGISTTLLHSSWYWWSPPSPKALHNAQAIFSNLQVWQLVTIWKCQFFINSLREISIVLRSWYGCYLSQLQPRFRSERKSSMKTFRKHGSNQRCMHYKCKFVCCTCAAS